MSFATASSSLKTTAADIAQEIQSLFTALGAEDGLSEAAGLAVRAPARR